MLPKSDNPKRKTVVRHGLQTPPRTDGSFRWSQRRGRNEEDGDGSGAGGKTLKPRSPLQAYRPPNEINLRHEEIDFRCYKESRGGCLVLL
ncbi:unnamed protein product [Lactuca saligna]|uniref:Uncharacterized protein n=1 Tax=Lactuca saligna TaxID=75948 RepID=A0AA36E0K8_LACSI|nr:unnamed protein product [Lactuca saligna]